MTKKFPILLATAVGRMLKAAMLGPQHPNVNYRGFNHLYANDLAMKGYANGKFPEGSVFVVEVIEAVPVENYTSEAARHHMDVMQKDSLRFASTGGWGYAQFEGDNSRRMLTLGAEKSLQYVSPQAKGSRFFQR